MEDRVAHVVADIRVRYKEVITLEDMAKTAYLSPFHFSRVFRQATGVSPGRFLAAVRIQEAQRLLRTTSLKVVDVSYEVGYGSIGTFTTRFTRSVGMSPTTFRDRGRKGVGEVHEIAGRTPGLVAGRTWGGVRGSVAMPEAPVGHQLFVGAFAGPITEGVPATCLRFDKAEAVDFELTPLPAGTWYIHAITVPATPSTPADPVARRPLVGISAPVRVEAGGVAEGVLLQMRALRPVDPPILLALPGLNLPDVVDVGRVAA